MNLKIVFLSCLIGRVSGEDDFLGDLVLNIISPIFNSISSTLLGPANFFLGSVLGPFDSLPIVPTQTFNEEVGMINNDECMTTSEFTLKEVSGMSDMTFDGLTIVDFSFDENVTAGFSVTMSGDKLKLEVDGDLSSGKDDDECDEKSTTFEGFADIMDPYFEFIFSAGVSLSDFSISDVIVESFDFKYKGDFEFTLTGTDLEDFDEVQDFLEKTIQEKADEVFSNLIGVEWVQDIVDGALSIIPF